MQLCNLTLRHGGSIMHTIAKQDATPAEILILRHIHGSDAVVDIRPTRVDKARSQHSEWERLSRAYDNANSMSAPGGDEGSSIMAKLFPGAMRKLPTTLKEIGLAHAMSPSAQRAAAAGAGAAAPNEDDVDLPVPTAEGEADDGAQDDPIEEAA